MICGTVNRETSVESEEHRLSPSVFVCLFEIICLLLSHLNVRPTLFFRLTEENFLTTSNSNQVVVYGYLSLSDMLWLDSGS